MEIWENTGPFCLPFCQRWKIAKILMVMNDLTLWIFDTPQKSQKLFLETKV
jgi:predicted pyridoxine 5'-phosphate oxidase superfamily flavin-nucleotide-binding protein